MSVNKWKESNKLWYSQSMKYYWLKKNNTLLMPTRSWMNLYMCLCHVWICVSRCNWPVPCATARIPAFYFYQSLLSCSICCLWAVSGWIVKSFWYFLLLEIHYSVPRLGKLWTPRWQSLMYWGRWPLRQTLSGKPLPPFVHELFLDFTSLHFSSPGRLRTGSGLEQRNQKASLPVFGVNNISPVWRQLAS